MYVHGLSFSATLLLSSGIITPYSGSQCVTRIPGVVQHGDFIPRLQESRHGWRYRSQKVPRPQIHHWAWRVWYPRWYEYMANRPDGDLSSSRTRVFGLWRHRDWQIFMLNMNAARMRLRPLAEISNGLRSNMANGSRFSTSATSMDNSVRPRFALHGPVSQINCISLISLQRRTPSTRYAVAREGQVTSHQAVRGQLRTETYA
jgi:hypothetical protein